ncbi:MAG: sulfotransferase family protein [Acidimicrobiales bacterium]
MRPSLLSLDPDELEAAARRSTGLDDLGSSVYRPGLEVLTGSLQDEARLTPAGRYFGRGQALGSLVNRLRLQQVWAESPAILQGALPAPIVIVGLPRTGTTLLQHLLAQDPAHRVLRNWEATSPAPPPRAGDDDDPRIQASERGMKLLDYLAPDARALHPVAATLPTECVTLFSNSFASLELATINFVPSYLRFCLDTPMAPHYDHFRRQLLTLQWHDPRERWLLKSPAHLFWLGELLDALPGARIVQTHRDPLDVLASFCSLSAVLCGIGSDHVDQRALGELWAPVWAEGLERTRAVRAQRPDDRFVDVDYPDLVGDPLGTVRRIYAGFDLELTAAAEQGMRRYLDEHPQHGAGVHRYTLEQFGLDRATESARFTHLSA